MARKKTIAVAVARAVAGFALSLATAAPLGADPMVFKAPAAPATYVGEFGTRFWFGRASMSKDLYDPSGAARVSRLDYDNLNIATGELFTRFDYSNGWFLKGYAGGGGLFGGKLKDEDFPPMTTPYSATLSDQDRGYLAYGSVDAGVKLLRGPDFHLGAFVGYHFLRDSVNGYGCGQIATNPTICAGGVPDTIGAVSQVNDWHALRVGLEGSVTFDRRWQLIVDGAWLPYVRLRGKDTHWLRIGTATGDFTGPIPEDGNGWGYQVDALLSYRVNEGLWLGAGGRYWHVRSEGSAHFEGRVVGMASAPQPVHWKADHFGAFLQASIKFGSYPLFGGGF